MRQEKLPEEESKRRHKTMMHRYYLQHRDQLIHYQKEYLRKKLKDPEYHKWLLEQRRLRRQKRKLECSSSKQEE